MDAELETGEQARTRLTIGMATFRDFDGVYFSLNALRLYHADVMDRCELLVVDNDPDGPQKERLRDYMNHLVHGAGPCPAAGARSSHELPRPWKVQYIEHRDAQGTAAPRDLIFRRASGDAVLVLDSHVDVWPGGIARLLAYFDEHPDSQDLLQGPLVMDSLLSVATHFDDVWRGGMWGTWGVAWRHPQGRLVAPRQSVDDQVDLFDLQTNERIETLELSWYGHELRLQELGFRQAADGDEPFEIPSQGLGLFACRRSAWLGFNPLFREFGGEEWYIHTKFRQAGHRCLCLPWLRWVHRFADPAAGRHYARSNYGKIRNYVLGLRELQLPFDRLRSHFVDGQSEDPKQPAAGGGQIGVDVWDRLVADALRDMGAEVVTTDTSAGPSLPPDLASLFASAIQTPSDINQHAGKLRELAAQCDTVVEFGHRPAVSTVALLAGQPRRLITGAESPPYNVNELQQVRGVTDFEYLPGTSLSVEIPPCDLLFLDTRHTAGQLSAELERHSANVARYIVLHDTATFGVRGEGGEPGLLDAIRPFVGEQSEWFIASHTSANHGLTVLSRRSEDRPPNPIRLWPRGYGPGTELKSLLATLGITPAASCDCHKHALQMDEWGVEGCRERRDEIVGWLQEGQTKWGWKDKVAAAARALASGLAFKLNPADPYRSLVEEAINLAERRKPVRAAKPARLATT